jgi:hypothetical protein
MKASNVLPKLIRRLHNRGAIIPERKKRQLHNRGVLKLFLTALNHGNLSGHTVVDTPAHTSISPGEAEIMIPDTPVASRCSSENSSKTTS